MEGSWNSALTAGAPHGGVLQAAAVPDTLLPEAVFPLAAFPEGAFANRSVPFEGLADGGLPYDDDPDAAYPASFPEDPFPEALLDRTTATGWFLPAADLTADGAGLIDQIRGYEDFKCWAAGQQARLAVAFEIRHREEQTELTEQGSPETLLAEDLDKKRPKEQSTGAA